MNTSSTTNRNSVSQKIDYILGSRRILGDANCASKLVTEIGLTESVDNHPAVELIFSLAAALELPNELTGRRSEHWDCIESLADLLRRASSRIPAPRGE